MYKNIGMEADTLNHCIVHRKDAHTYTFYLNLAFSHKCGL